MCMNTTIIDTVYRRRRYFIEKGGTAVIICMCGGHGSNKIENRGIRVRKSLFGGYGSNSP